jgi:hypothetical protein
VKQGDLGEYEENAREKAKCTIYKAKELSPPQTKPYGWQTLIPPRKSANREESRGLVKMSANCLSVSIYLISMSPSLHDLSESGVSSQHVSSFYGRLDFWLLRWH